MPSPIGTKSTPSAFEGRSKLAVIGLVVPGRFENVICWMEPYEPDLVAFDR